MIGYWNDAEATAAAIRDGWLHTGDLARWDEDGYCWFAGRKKEIIVRGGVVVSVGASRNSLSSMIRAMRLTVLSGVLSLLCTTGLGADTYERQPGVDAQHYGFRLTLLTSDSNDIQCEATVTLRIAAGVRDSRPRVAGRQTGVARP